ncbi:hypothetical protein LGK95_09145 [Clostridium algoriphilum]|uniref:hypothetical protein n=1 Tax=Clostridium algoriphilum TaxID=198347 RepID=UPI001CF4F22B|nr:hypothetical protein [Clostridium algoriphilum]MCB2293689.1 hypothetical protein [Clostridium algoriphilum]
MQKKIISIVITSIVINLIFIFVVIGQKIDVKNKNDEIRTLTSKSENLNKKVKEYDTNSNTQALLTDEKVKNNIGNFIDAQFNYTNKNYKNRFENIKKYVTTDVYNALKGAGNIEAPTTSIQSKVENLNIYLTTNNNQAITALVNITTTYSVQGVEGKPINQIYELESKEQEKDKWMITKCTLMGNFQPYSTNK